MKSVLFVCTANRCRSPMAEALLKTRVAELGQSTDWQIASAGTWAEAGLPAMPTALTVISNRGASLEAHRSQPVVADLLQSYSVVLVMTANHREGLSIEFPDAAGKIMLLAQLVGQAFDIEDPVGGSEADYETCAAELAQILEQGFHRLTELADRKIESG